MSYNAGQPPTPSSESTAIEIRRKEGTVVSFVAATTVTAGQLMKLTNSGALQTVGTEDANAVIGAAFYQAASGARVVVGKGQVRSFWDGVGTVTAGVEVTLSAVQSGWFSTSGGAFLSGLGSIGYYAPLPGGGTLVAANSGTLQPIMIP
jgi:hypothetical protein